MKQSEFHNFYGNFEIFQNKPSPRLKTESALSCRLTARSLFISIQRLTELNRKAIEKEEFPSSSQSPNTQTPILKPAIYAIANVIRPFAQLDFVRWMSQQTEVPTNCPTNASCFRCCAAVCQLFIPNRQTKLSAAVFVSK